MSTFDDLSTIFRSLPRNPVSPENRNVTRLLPSPMVAPGRVYRISLPEMFSDELPRMVMHPSAVKLLRLELMTTPWARDKNIELIDQEIADLCEECFARQELQSGG